MIETPKRFYVWNRCLYFTYKMKYSEGIAPYNGKMHHGWDEQAVYIGVSSPIFEYNNLYYDGHIIKSVTVFGIRIGWISTYSWEQK